MDAYRISVSILLATNGAAVLGLLARDLLGVHTKVKDLEGGFNKLHLAIGGALAAGAGVALLATMSGLVSKTAEYSDELAKLKTLGGEMTQAVASGAISSQAFDIAQRVPMKVTDLMKIPGAAYSILGQEDAMKVWEPLAQFQWVMQNQSGFKGNAGEDMSKFLRSGELSGRLTDPTTHKAAIEELQRFLNLSQKVMAATHGMVTPSTMLGMAQQAGFSMRDMSDEGFMNMAIMAQAMGGPRGGTAMLSLYNQVATGKMTRQAASGMQDLGLLKEGEWSSDHGHVVVNQGAMSRLGHLLGKNPMDFVDQIYGELEKQGITDPEDQKRHVAAALSRQTSERFVIEQMMNRNQMAAERGRMSQGMGSADAFNVFNNESVTANIKALGNAWDNLLFAVAGPNSENAIAVMQSLTSAINTVTKYIGTLNPDTITGVAKGLAALGVVLTGAGVVALMAALGPAGWIAAGLLAVGFAAAKWGPDIFKSVWSTLESSAAALTRGFNSISSAIAAFTDSIAAIYNRIKGFLSSTSLPGAAPNAYGNWTPAQKLGAGMQPVRFDPGTGASRGMSASFSLNVDGHALAQSVIDHLESIYGMPTGAPAADGVNNYFGGDHQYTST